MSYRLQEDHPIMSFDLCKNGRYAVLNISGQVRIEMIVDVLIN